MRAVAFTLSVLCLQANAYDGSLDRDPTWGYLNKHKRNDDDVINKSGIKKKQMLKNYDLKDVQYFITEPYIINELINKKTMRKQLVKRTGTVREVIDLSDIDFEIDRLENGDAQGNGGMYVNGQPEIDEQELKTYNHLEKIIANDRRIQKDGRSAKFLMQTLKKNNKIFGILKRNVKDRAVRKKITNVSREFNSKLTKLIRRTKGNSKMKNSKYIISKAIEISDRILNRLVNYVRTDLKQRGLFSQSADFMNGLKKAVQPEEVL